jgi:aspartokinase
VVQKINAVLLPDHDFFAISEGTREIILIVPQETVKDIKNIFRNKMKAEYRNLVALSVRFSPDYVAQPNVLYALLGVLAIKRINLIEIVSTYTELTFILEQKDLEIAVQVFHKYIQE